MEKALFFDFHIKLAKITTIPVSVYFIRKLTFFNPFYFIILLFSYRTVSALFVLSNEKWDHEIKQSLGSSHRK